MPKERGLFDQLCQRLRFRVVIGWGLNVHAHLHLTIEVGFLKGHRTWLDRQGSHLSQDSGFRIHGSGRRDFDKAPSLE
jgi:hypothetical protein